MASWWNVVTYALWPHVLGQGHGHILYFPCHGYDLKLPTYTEWFIWVMTSAVELLQNSLCIPPSRATSTQESASLLLETHFVTSVHHIYTFIYTRVDHCDRVRAVQSSHCKKINIAVLFWFISFRSVVVVFLSLSSSVIIKWLHHFWRYCEQCHTVYLSFNYSVLYRFIPEQ